MTPTAGGLGGGMYGFERTTPPCGGVFYLNSRRERRNGKRLVYDTAGHLGCVGEVVGVELE